LSLLPDCHPAPRSAVWHEDCYALLRAASWSLGEYRTDRPWHVEGSHGENLVRATGDTADDAWRAALAQARALGLPLQG
jgi:hypothetical protein